MKNFLTSILCIAVSFCATYFILDKNYNQNSVLSASKEDTNNTFTEEVSEESTSDAIDESSDQDFSDITSDFAKWSEYNKENIDLNSDFIAVDTDGEEITKKEFLESLKTGNYIPKKLYDSESMYQLYRLKGDTDEKISKSIKVISSASYTYFLKEGKDFPEFNFVDLNGNNYTSDNTKGQYIVLVCWFVQCTQCVQEFPELNNLYDKYEDREDILFLSLAFDDKSKIQKILSKKEFRYPVVPSQKSFIKNEIKPLKYPAYMIIDKYGATVKTVSDSESLTEALDNLINGDLISEEIM